MILTSDNRTDAGCLIVIFSPSILVRRSHSVDLFPYPSPGFKMGSTASRRDTGASTAGDSKSAVPTRSM
jgi:hypothetical protein